MPTTPTTGPYLFSNYRQKALARVQATGRPPIKPPSPKTLFASHLRKELLRKDPRASEDRIRKKVAEKWVEFQHKDALEEIARADYQEFRALQRLFRAGLIGSKPAKARPMDDSTGHSNTRAVQVAAEINIEDMEQDEIESQEAASADSWTLQPSACFSASMHTPGNSLRQPSKKISNKNAFASPGCCKRMTRMSSNGLWALCSPALNPNTPGLKLTKCSSSRKVVRAQESAMEESDMDEPSVESASDVEEPAEFKFILQRNAESYKASQLGSCSPAFGGGFGTVPKIATEEPSSNSGSTASGGCGEITARLDAFRLKQS